MPPKAESDGTKLQVKGANALCGIRPPGPKYQLKTVVGFKGHCLTKLRNPAYTFGRRQATIEVYEGPGPKYKLDVPYRGGYTFGYAWSGTITDCGPGPKYNLKYPPNGPIFAMKWRTNHRKADPNPGPHNVKHVRDAPAFSIALKAESIKGRCGPAPHKYAIEPIKPRAPMYSFGYRYTGAIICETPGPKYYPKLDRLTPLYSFGTKHNECSPPHIIECDDRC